MTQLYILFHFIIYFHRNLLAVQKICYVTHLKNMEKELLLIVKVKCLEYQDQRSSEFTIKEDGVDSSSSFVLNMELASQQVKFSKEAAILHVLDQRAVQWRELGEPEDGRSTTYREWS